MKPADSEKRNGKCTLSDHNLVINGGWVGGGGVIISTKNTASQTLL